MIHGHERDHFLTWILPHFTLAAKRLFTSGVAYMDLKVNNSVPKHNGSLCFTQLPPTPLTFSYYYYHYISGIKWSSNDNNIVYRDYFWDNISSNKSSYCDKSRKSHPTQIHITQDIIENYYVEQSYSAVKSRVSVISQLIN